MSFASKPYWWVVCDTDGCDARTPDHDDEWSAWESRETAAEMLHDADWVVDDTAGPDHVLHYCPDHWVWSDDETEQVGVAEADTCTVFRGGAA